MIGVECQYILIELNHVGSLAGSMLRFRVWRQPIQNQLAPFIKRHVCVFNELGQAIVHDGFFQGGKAESGNRWGYRRRRRHQCRRPGDGCLVRQSVLVDGLANQKSAGGVALALAGAQNGLCLTVQRATLL